MRKGDNKKRLAIITPCYNEEEVLPQFQQALTAELEKLDKSNYDYQIIFVNDGSRDNTLELTLQMARENPKIKYVSLSRNFGKESAMLAGLEAADADCVIIMDADLQHPPQIIHHMLQKHEEGYDQVIAKRDRTGEPLKATFFAKTYYKFVNRMIDVKLVDGAGDFRLMSRQAVNAVIALKETNRFSKGIFTWVGFNQAFIEYKNQQRAAAESKWSFKKLIRYGIEGVVSFNVQPLRLCVYFGCSLLFLSLIYLIYLFVRILLYGVELPGYFTTITMISMLGGVQLISLGIIGEYVGRIYAEVKKRPPYIVQATNLKERSHPENRGQPESKGEKRHQSSRDNRRQSGKRK